MKKICCYCRKPYGRTIQLPPGAVSHGICPDCVQRAEAEVDAALKVRKNKGSSQRMMQMFWRGILGVAWAAYPQFIATKRKLK